MTQHHFFQVLFFFSLYLPSPLNLLSISFNTTLRFLPPLHLFFQLFFFCCQMPARPSPSFSQHPVLLASAIFLPIYLYPLYTSSFTGPTSPFLSTCPLPPSSLLSPPIPPPFLIPLISLSGSNPTSAGWVCGCWMFFFNLFILFLPVRSPLSLSGQTRLIRLHH